MKVCVVGGVYEFTWYLAPNNAFPEGLWITSSSFVADEEYELRVACIAGFERDAKTDLFFGNSSSRKSQLNRNLKKWHACHQKNKKDRVSLHDSCMAHLRRDREYVYSAFIVAKILPKSVDEVYVFAQKCADLMSDPDAYLVPKLSNDELEVFSENPRLNFVMDGSWKSLLDNKSAKSGSRDTPRLPMRGKPGGPSMSSEQMAGEVAVRAVTMAQQVPEIMSDLAEKAHEAKMTLMEAVTGISTGMDHLRPMRKEMTEELKEMRTSVTSEVAATLKPLEDIRKFFLGPDHDKEIARLREFVELCERLKKLKDEGFLDSVADTLLKLS
jgi:hypothetical protein